jgi:glutamate dehydrogenase/leucine dehydrogenase
MVWKYPMTHALDQVLDYSNQHGVSLRDGALMLAVQRVATVWEEREIFP